MNDAIFTSDGTRVITASSDCTVKVSCMYWYFKSWALSLGEVCCVCITDCVLPLIGLGCEEYRVYTYI